MFKDFRTEYAVKIAPLDDATGIEYLLNSMSADGWELYTMHEAQTESGKPCYNCIFSREVEIIEEDFNTNVGDLDNPLEKMFRTAQEPYNLCLQFQRKIREKKNKIRKIKSSLENISTEEEHAKLNLEISRELNELKEIKAELQTVIDPQKMYNRIEVDKIKIVLSEELGDLTSTDSDNELLCETVKLRQKLTDKLGYVIPYVKFELSEELDENEFEIVIRNSSAFKGKAYAHHRVIETNLLNIKKDEDVIIEDDILNHTQVAWVDETRAKDFWENGRNAAQFITDALEFVTLKYVDDILDYQDMNNYLELVIKENQFLVESLIPEVITLGEIRHILAQLIKENISVSDIVFIFEKISDTQDSEEDAISTIRFALRRQISASLANENNEIYAICLSDKTQDKFRALMENSDNEEFMDDNLAENLLDELYNVTAKHNNLNECTPIIVQNDIRNFISEILSTFYLKCMVVAPEEITPDYTLIMLDEIDV